MMKATNVPLLDSKAYSLHIFFIRYPLYYSFYLIGSKWISLNC